MIRFFLIFAFVLGSAQAANATICTIPTTLVNGSIVDAAQLNGNFTSLQSCGNAVDSTNMGSGGIFASQIKPTSAAQASFGGTFVYAFPAGLTINGALLRANSGLTVVGTTNLAATTFSVAPTMSGANINANTIPNGALITTPITTITAGTGITTSGSAPNITISAPNSVFPTYTITGVTVAPLHSVFGTLTFSGVASLIVTLSGAAVYTSQNTYECNASDNSSPGNSTSPIFHFGLVSGTSFNVFASNPSTGGAVTLTNTIPFKCDGN